MSRTPIPLAGRSIAITGASSGIGLATAEACARAGMRVAVAARRLDRLEAFVERTRAAGGEAIAFQLDVRDRAACESFVDATVSAFGSLYAVYANAGYGLERAVADTDDAQLRDIFEVNFFGSMNIVRPALAAMRRNTPPHRGHILLCSSCLAKTGTPYYAAYSATKAAQDHFGRAMRLELEPESIHVSTVHPIRTETELFDLVKARSGKPVIDYSPQKRFQSAETVAAYTLDCLRRPRGEVWTGPSGIATRLAMAAGVAFPGLADWGLRRMLRAKK